MNPDELNKLMELVQQHHSVLEGMMKDKKDASSMKELAQVNPDVLNFLGDVFLQQANKEAQLQGKEELTPDQILPKFKDELLATLDAIKDKGYDVPKSFDLIATQHGYSPDTKEANTSEGLTDYIKTSQIPEDKEDNSQSTFNGKQAAKLSPREMAALITG